MPDVERWFDSKSGTPGNANRAPLVLSVLLTQAELWDIQPQGPNPCRNMRRYRLKPGSDFWPAAQGPLRLPQREGRRADDHPRHSLAEAARGYIRI